MPKESSEVSAQRNDAAFVKQLTERHEAEVLQSNEMSRRPASLPDGHEGK